MLRTLAAALIACAVLVSGVAAAQPLVREEIRDFSVVVEARQDASVVVTEEIEVVALGREIRRGIYRDIPLGGVGIIGLGRSDFELMSLERDGRREPWRIERTDTGLRIYFGAEDVFLEPGIHRYSLVYAMSGQVGRFEDFDEVYWNATGNDWAFNVVRARAVVVPPQGTDVFRLAVYTGYRGEQGQDAVISRDEAGRPVFTTTRPLRAGEGLTVAAGWPKGFVVEADARTRFYQWLSRNGAYAAAGLTLIIVLGYYLFVWFRIGRDPRPGTIIPIYHPELPPAAMRYISRMGFDPTAFSAALISLAVKGYVTIHEDDDGKTVRRTPAGAGRKPMSEGEARLFRALFAGHDEVVLDKSDRGTLTTAAEALKQHFDRTFNRIYFRRNAGWFVLGVVVTVLGWVAAAALSVDYLDGRFLSVFPAIFAVVFGQIAYQTWRQIADFRATGGMASLFAALMSAAILSIFGVVIAGLFVLFGLQMGLAPFLAMTAVALINVLFYHLLKAPTAVGRGALDEIEGTKLYLKVAEADRLKFHNPPDRTPEHFHELLPYAVALDVETAWTNQFRDAIEAAKRKGEEDVWLSPSWYSGRGGRGFGEVGDLSSLGRALSGAYGAATVSNSSGSGFSGSGGGGSSGGGGGGGGGGGW